MEDHMVERLSTDKEGKCNSNNNRSIDVKILNAFWSLVETNKSDRLKAAEYLIVTLSEKQKRFEGPGLCPEVAYSLERLVKGVASTRKAARLGFTLTLTEVLRSCLEIPVKDVLQSAVDHLPLKGNQDKCCSVIGQALIYGALIRSGRLKDSPNEIPSIVALLRKLSQNRSYIEQCTMKIISELLSQLSEEEFKKHLWSHLKGDLTSSWEDFTPEKLWLLLFCRKCFPNVVTEKFLKKHWDTNDLLDNSSYQHLSKIIKQSTSVHPNVHLLCSEVLNSAIERKDLKEFWKIVVDNSLFDPGQREKVFLGFMLIRMVLPQLKKAKQVLWVLSLQFQKVFMRVIRTPHHPLNSAASELADFLMKFVKECENSKIQMVVVKMFLFSPGTLQFDQLTKKKTVATMVSSLKADTSIEYWNLMKTIFLAKGEESIHDDELPPDQERTFALNQMALLVGNSEASLEIEWKHEVVQFLLVHSFFDLKEPIEDLPQCQVLPLLMTPSVRKACQNSFFKALGFPMRLPGGASAQLKHQCTLLHSVIDFANALLQQSDKVVPVTDVSEIAESWNKILTMIHKLNKQSRKDGKLNESNAFVVLFQYLAVQLFVDPKCCKEVLEDLCECCSRTLKLRKSQCKGKNGQKNKEPDWIDVVTDVLLQILSRASHFTRTLVISAFRLLCPFVTEKTLHQIFDVINPQKSSDDGPLIEDDEEEENDVEFESGSSSEDEAKKSEEMEEDSDEDDEFRNRLQKALGSAADVSDAESTYLTDSEMFQLDDAISEAFRSRKKKSHRKPSEEQQFLLHFRIRCMDLIMTYLKSEPPCLRILQCILPLVAAVEYGHKQKHEDQLGKKASTVLHHIFKLRKFQDVASVDKSYLSDLLNALLGKMRKTTDVAVAKLLSSLAVYVILCGRRRDSQLAKSKKISSEDKSWFFQEYEKALVEYAEQSNSHLNPLMFQSLMNSCPDVAPDLGQLLQKYSFHPDIRLYKKTQCLGLLNAALRFSQSQEDVTPDTWSQLCKPLVQSLIETIKTVVNSEDVKPMYVTQLLEVLVTIVQISKKFNKNPLNNHSELLEVLKKFDGEQRKKLQFNGQCLWRKLIVHLGGSSLLQEKQRKKRKLKDDTQEVNVQQEENESKKKIKKRRKSKK